ncbi:MAG TPA: DMT family transporter [Fibrobacteraceae bacterium]|nr:DMT family transporter [Fibrobacteraceae bacterium]
MSYLLLAAGSAFFLGFYDLVKKKSLDHNAVWPVLFLCTFASVVLLLPPLLLSRLYPQFAQVHHFWVPSLNAWNHLRLMLKALIVSLSWACTYQAIKHLPISISAPVRASAPLLTLVLAIFFWAERPSLQQWAGIAVTLVAYWIFALAGRREGSSFHRSPWVALMFLGTLFGALSSLYDKYLLHTVALDATTVQSWFSVYMLILQGVWVLCFWPAQKRKEQPFQWRWSIPLVGILLVVADQFYFRALAEPEALLAVVTVIRRSSVAISFALGILILKESLYLGKIFGLMGILLGVALMVLR